METLLDIRSVVQSDLNIDDNSSQFPKGTVDEAIDRSYIKCTRIFPWPQLRDAKKTSTAISQQYYTLPPTWSPNSAWKLQIDGYTYGEEPDGSPISFQDFLLFKELYANSTEKKWAVHNNLIFVSPTPTAVGNKNLLIWGQKNRTKMTLDADTTIFSSNMPECNEAIALEAEAILQKKGENLSKGQLINQDAEKILVLAFNRMRQEAAKYEKIQPLLDVPDFFAGNGRGTPQITGNFYRR